MIKSEHAAPSWELETVLKISESTELLALKMGKIAPKILRFVIICTYIEDKNVPKYIKIVLEKYPQYFEA